MNPPQLWDRYRAHLCVVEPLGVSVDISRMRFADGFLASMATPAAGPAPTSATYIVVRSA